MPLNAHAHPDNSKKTDLATNVDTNATNVSTTNSTVPIVLKTELKNQPVIAHLDTTPSQT